MIQISLGDLAALLGGQLSGDPEIVVTGIAPLDVAGEKQVTFLSNTRLRGQLAQCRAAAVILNAEDSEAVADAYGGARIVLKNPYAGFARTAQWFADRQAIPPVPGRHPSAVIDPSAQVDPSASIGPHVTIEAGAVVGAHCVIDSGSFIGRDARVGADTHFHPRVTFLAGCRIGARGIIHSGAVIGGDGFGFANEGGAWIKIPQTGAVSIGDDVEIGANTTIDRGALTDTVVEDGVKLDNQIQVAHNCHIGAHTAMAGCVGIAGSTTIGKHCTVGGAAMINGHIHIADRVHVTAGTLVPRSINEPGEYAGFYPMATRAEWEKSAALVRNLSAMREKIRNLERTLKALIRNGKP
ncbi:MAG: UDP-3-O-(3-hydroxymyristoyl)glucosamine N-acyltransferase [Noviherbaspirillum sp.]